MDTKENTLNIEPFVDKWKAFGWNISEADGHNYSEIIKSLEGFKKNNKPSKIIYDRTNSSFSLYSIPKSDLSTSFKEIKYLLISGITPALSSQCQKNILNMVELAKNHDVKIIYDINYRKNLWSISQCRLFT